MPKGCGAASRAEGRLPASELVRQRGGGLRAVRQQLAHEQRLAVPLRRGAADGIARLDAVKASPAAAGDRFLPAQQLRRIGQMAVIELQLAQALPAIRRRAA